MITSLSSWFKNQLFLCTVCLYSATVLLITLQFNALPGLVVDEIYHVPQGIEYCKKNFSSWDDKITTLPGLYILSTILFSYLKLCTVSWLRLTNVVGAIINLMLFIDVIHMENLVYKKSKKMYTLENILSGINLALLPPLLLFNCLYYTDTWSITSVMLIITFSNRNKHLCASVAGLFSILMRQTNIVWVAMVAGKYIMDFIIRKKTPANKKKYGYKESMRGIRLFMKNGITLHTIPINVWYDVTCYGLVFIAFLAFVIINEGIVVGDRSAHAATLHIPQLFYFSVFVGVFGLPYLVPEIMHFIKFSRQNILMLSLLALIAAFVVHFNTLVHPYLLADNRHYTFYIWQRVYNAHYLVRYLMIAPYFFCYYAIFQLIPSNRNITFMFTFVPCAIAVLVLQKMIEIRYYLIPFIMLRLKFKPSTKVLLAESILFICLNLVTIYIFLNKEFYWENWPYAQRIIW